MQGFHEGRDYSMTLVCMVLACSTDLHGGLYGVLVRASGVLAVVAYKVFALGLADGEDVLERPAQRFVHNSVYCMAKHQI